MGCGLIWKEKKEMGKITYVECGEWNEEGGRKRGMKRRKREREGREGLEEEEEVEEAEVNNRRGRREINVGRRVRRKRIRRRRN